MKNKITKKIFLLSSLLGGIIAATRGTTLWCNINNWTCRDQNDNISILFLVFVPTFVISLITYKLPNEIFNLWSKFTIIWIPLSVFIIAITPNTSGILQVIDKEYVALVLSILFVIISLVIISYKFFFIKKN